MVNTCFSLLLAAATSVAYGAQAAVLRGNVNESNVVSPHTVMCRITMIASMYWDEQKGRAQSKQAAGCIPIVNGTDSHFLLSIDLPSRITNAYSSEIHQGALFLRVDGATIADDALQVSDKTSFHVLDKAPLGGRQLQQLTTKGKMTVLVVRVTTSDGVGPDYSLDEMRSRIFGSGIGMRSQFAACSFGQLMMEDTGGMDVVVPHNMSHYSSGAMLVNDAEQVILDTVGRASYEIADKVMFCQPPGTGNWIASAGVNYYRSNYNNEWCLSLSADMHEMGHCLGMLHSGEGNDPYEDQTGYMGYGEPQQDSPLKCYNGYKNHLFGWYQRREVIVDPTESNLIELATFVDFDKTTENQPVLLNIGNQYFIQYNRAKLFNIETTDKRDAVTITENTPGWSHVRAGLLLDEEWTIDNYSGTGRTLVVKVCQQMSTNDVDSMMVSIGLDTSYCATTEPTSRPTSVPTQSPTKVPTVRPTTVPTTMLPTASPTSQPTAAPSGLPTHVDSLVPSAAPSELPTLVDSYAPSSSLGKCTCIEDGSVHFL